MEYLCKFLCLNPIESVVSVFGRLGGSTATPPVDDLSYNIRHNYPGRLVTYDAEEVGEPRTIRMSDMTPSTLDVRYPDRPKGGQNKGADGKRSRSEKKDCPKLFDRIGKISSERKRRLEHTSRQLYRFHLEHRARLDGEGNQVEWEDLTSSQKFRFYWKALTHLDLHATPYENFKAIFNAYHKKDNSRDEVQRMKELARHTWQHMSAEQRMPFTLHALLYHVSNRRVDPFDKNAVLALLDTWR